MGGSSRPGGPRRDRRWEARVTTGCDETGRRGGPRRRQTLAPVRANEVWRRRAPWSLAGVGDLVALHGGVPADEGEAPRDQRHFLREHVVAVTLAIRREVVLDVGDEDGVERDGEEDGRLGGPDLQGGGRGGLAEEGRPEEQRRAVIDGFRQHERLDGRLAGSGPAGRAADRRRVAGL